jgi:hypothetical protein
MSDVASLGTRAIDRLDPAEANQRVDSNNGKIFMPGTVT